MPSPPHRAAAPRALAALLLCASLLAGCGAAPAERVVLVSIDTLRADRVGAYGDARARTPTLDRVAAEGARFDAAISPAPLTLPSHTSLLSALDPPRHGVRDNSLFRVPGDVPLLQEALRAHGFATAAFVGALVLDGSTGLSRGFDVYDDRMASPTTGVETGFPERPADAVIDAALGWLAGAPDRFFLFVHLYDPHAAYQPPLGFRLALPGDPYAGEIAFADAEVGRLLAAVDARWPGGGTLVAITSDHGESLGEHGEATHAYGIYDATQRIPLVLSGPGVPRGRVVEDVVRLVDVAPTLLALAGAPALAGADGSDLVPLLRGRGAEPRVAYVETLATQMSFGWSPLLGLRTRTHKWIRAPRPELFDLRADPRELRNLAQEEGALARELDAALEARLASARPVVFGEALTSDERAKLEALGYVEAAPALDPETLGRVGGLDPKDHLAPTAAAVAEAERLLALDRPRDALAALDPVAAGGFWVDQTRARAALAAGETQRAEAVARAVTNARPTYAPAWLQLGEVLEASGRLDEARAAFSRAREAAPRDAAPVLAQARIAAASGDAAGAEALEREAAALPSASIEARVRIAAREIAQGRDAEARERLAGLGDAIHGADVAGRLAAAELAAGKPDAARARIEAALASGRALDPDLLRLHGALLLALGRTDEAVAALEQRLSFRPNDPRPEVDLAFALAVRARASDLERAGELAQRAAGGTQSAETRAAALDTLARVESGRRSGGAAAEASLLWRRLGLQAEPEAPPPAAQR